MATRYQVTVMAITTVVVTVDVEPETPWIAIDKAGVEKAKQQVPGAQEYRATHISWEDNHG